MKIHIYKIWFPTSNKCYVGQTRHLKATMQRHLNRSFPIGKALIKYDDWNFSILHTCKNRDEANRVEIEEIRNHNSIAPDGYNLTRGGEGNDSPRSEETKRKLSESHKGLQAGEKNPMFGVERPDVSALNKIRFIGIKRVPFSEEHKRKLSESQVGNQKAIGEQSKIHKLKKAIGRRKFYIAKLEAELLNENSDLFNND